MADSSTYSISYSNRSLADAIIIKEYLLYKFTQREVSKFYHMLSVFENIVSKFPELYPQSTKNKKLRRAVLSKELSVFYTISKDAILIVAILDNRMGSAKWP